MKIPSALVGGWPPAAAEKAAALTRLPGTGWMLIVWVMAGCLVRILLEWQLRLTLTEIFRRAPPGSVVVIKKRGLGGAMWVQVGEVPVSNYRLSQQRELQ